MSAATTPPLHVLRGILRHLKSSSSSNATSSTVQSATPNAAATLNDQPTLQQHIISQYRQSKSLPPHKAKIQRQIAYDYYILKQDLVERGRLHDLDQGADEKLSPHELTRRSAARAGLQLPKLVSE